MQSIASNQKIHYTLRIASAMCFIGHGTFGIITKPIWSNYFAVFGVSHALSYQLMPILGGFDVLLGLVLLVYPAKAIPLWLVIWGFVTALLRPLSGEPFAEFIERAGNFGAPLALLILSGGAKNISGWLTPIHPGASLDPAKRKQLLTCLRIVCFFLLLGHGWLNIIEKKGILDQYAALGFSNPASTAHIVGIAEVAAAFITLVRPLRPLILAFLLWKMASELFYPHYEIFEWVERGGSYGSLLALWLVLERKPLAHPVAIYT